MKTKLLPLLLFAFATNAFADGFTNTIDGFTNNGDGTVTDTVSGLIWQACAGGQTFNISTGSCDGTAKNYTHTDALALTSNLGGQSDWRVPNISELLSIVDLKTSNPAMNKFIFPNPHTTYFWSASDYATYSGQSHAWIVDFGDGVTFSYSRNDGYAVRLVRGGQSFYFDTLKLADFVDNKNGTATNNKTGLIWQRCAVGQTWNGSNCDGKAATYTQADAAKLTSNVGGQTDWRLPSLRELQTIVDYTKSNPSTNLVIFPDAPSNEFWTTTPTAGRADNFWSVNFYFSSSFFNSKTNTFSARLVRGTLSNSGAVAITPVVSVGVDLSTTLSASTTRVKINENLTYTATVTNNGMGTANNSSLKFYLPPRNVSIVSMPSDCVTTGKSLTCSLGNLAAGANASRAITVIYTKSGGASVSALALTDSNDMNSANNVSRVVTAIKK